LIKIGGLAEILVVLIHDNKHVYTEKSYSEMVKKLAMLIIDKKLTLTITNQRISNKVHANIENTT